MKSISAGLAAHIAGEVTTLATCWKLTRTDSVVQGFTDHDRDIIFSGVTYKAATGFTPTAISTSAALNVDNLDVEGALDSTAIGDADILAGKYDFAEIEIFLLNYADLTQGALKLRRGWLGEVSLKNHQFTAEVRGLTQRLSQTIGELYSPSCRARLGDARCKVNLASHTVTGSATSVVDRQQFTDSARTEASGLFNFGKITFTGGANNGLSMEVKEYSYKPGAGGTFILALPMPYVISASNGYSVHKGCDKTLSVCKSRFGNVVNFRGEPHVPGLDRSLETAGTRSEW